MGAPKMSGCAWRVYYVDGRVINWIESPFPKTPISLAIFPARSRASRHRFLIGTRSDAKRSTTSGSGPSIKCAPLGIEPTAQVMRRYEASMQYGRGEGACAEG